MADKKCCFFNANIDRGQWASVSVGWRRWVIGALPGAGVSHSSDGGGLRPIIVACDYIYTFGLLNSAMMLFAVVQPRTTATLNGEESGEVPALCPSREAPPAD